MTSESSANEHREESFRLLAERVRNAFQSTIGVPPQALALSPGRVNLIGEHIDYNDGIVLPFAIERYTCVAGAIRSADKICKLQSLSNGESIAVRLDEELSPKPGCWSNYVIGVLAQLQRLGHELPGMNILVGSDVPIGAGLSSSAALEVATLTLMESILSIAISKFDKALLCQKVEHEFANVPCGIMDQAVVVFGQKNKIVQLDCHTNEVALLPIEDEVSFLVVDTGASHQLSDGEYARRRTTCESALRKLGLNSFRDASPTDDVNRLSEEEHRRYRHVVSEISRVESAIEQLRVGDWSQLGNLLYKSHYSLRDDFEVSCVELDFLVDQFETMGEHAGVFGARMTGGGFGGCVIAAVQKENVEEVATVICREFASQFDRQPPVFSTRPSDGAFVFRDSD